MTAAWATVVSAAVTGTLAVLVEVVRRLRTENREQHGEALSAVQLLHEDVRHVRRRLDDHIDTHHQEDDGR